VQLPEIRLEIVEDLSPPAQSGFIRLKRRRYRAHYPDGTTSAPFVYDEIDRDALDAVVIVAHYRAPDGAIRVYLRSSVRPPVANREPERSPVPELDPPHGVLWELPAGLIEPGEQNAKGPQVAAQRELAEELGFEVAVGSLKELGPSTFPAPGFIGERHFFFEVAVDPEQRKEPSLDGSALEHFGQVIALPLEEALDHCRSGRIVDSKTELALRRLSERAP
jgi:ADP-ribose pyrophosphatase